MSLIHRVGAGLIVFGGLVPMQAQAQWPGLGCGCGAPAPMAPMASMMPMAPIGPVAPMAPVCGPELMASPMGPRMWGPRMRAHRHRPWVYRSRTVIRGHNQPMFGDATMGLPLGDCCGSQAPMFAPESAPLIVPQSTMIPQQIMTYVDVPKTVMRQEAVQVQVPTTTYKQVTVDEGSFQQVWVPKMVTKSVPQTVMQTQVQYRQVPQTVMERVPQVSTQWTPTTASTCNQPVTAISPFPIATATTVTPEYNPPPVHPVPNPIEETAQGPTPVVPRTSQVQEWQQVKQRQQTIQQQKYEIEAINDSTTQGSGYRVPKAAGRFSSQR